MESLSIHLLKELAFLNKLHTIIYQRTEESLLVLLSLFVVIVGFPLTGCLVLPTSELVLPRP